VSKKEKKKEEEEEKKRKEQFEGFKEDMLEALDVRFEALKKERAGKAGSVRSSPRQAFARLGAPPFGMGGQMPNALDPMMAQKFGGGGGMGMGTGMGMGMGPGMPMNMGGNPYAMGIPGGMSKMPGMGGDPMSGGRQMRPHQMAGMAFDDEMSMDDMGGMGVDNPYSGPGMGGRGMPPTFRSPGGRRDPGGMNFDHMAALYGRRAGMINHRERRKPLRGRGRAQQAVNFDVASDDSDLSPHQRGGRQGKVERKAIFDNMAGKLARNILQCQQSLLTNGQGAVCVTTMKTFPDPHVALVLPETMQGAIVRMRSTKQVMKQMKMMHTEGTDPSNSPNKQGSCCELTTTLAMNNLT
jgi:hypothetical protein